MRKCRRVSCRSGDGAREAERVLFLRVLIDLAPCCRPGVAAGVLEDWGLGEEGGSA